VLIAQAEYGTDDIFPWSDLESTFKRPILFEFNSDSLLAGSFPIMDEIVDVMMSRPSLRLEVQGHTDNVGTREFNQILSEGRARNVMDALIERGIEQRRLRYRGFGFSQPIASNDTEQGRTQNRRTVFLITAK
jgi:outer membrane protein OmpA-like peptidoglycan-associated protein